MYVIVITGGNMKIDDLLNIDIVSEEVGISPLCTSCDVNCNPGCSTSSCSTCTQSCSAGCNNVSSSSLCSDACSALGMKTCLVTCSAGGLLEVSSL